MRFALISDIHGNLPALEAVLTDIQQAGVDHIICLGDIANIGPYPAECLDVIRGLNCQVVQGNHELYLLGQELDEDWQTCPTWSPVRWTMQQLRPDQFELMRQLPYQVDIPTNGRIGATFVHASPRNQFLGFQAFHTDDEIAERMNHLDNTTLFCGHTHRPLYRRWSNSWLVNVGAVGMPLDGTPEAKYVIATQQRRSWHVEFRFIEYNLDHTMAAFDQSGLQKEGGAITAAFRYQMLTGCEFFTIYVNGLRQYAQALNVPIRDIYASYPVPPQIQQWL